MRLKASIKPVTYMKTHAADILAAVTETRQPMIITHHGEGKLIIQDLESYQAMKEALALLKIAALGRAAVERGAVRPAGAVFQALERTRRRRG